jgi:hypothetical protein
VVQRLDVPASRRLQPRAKIPLKADFGLFQIEL